MEDVFKIITIGLVIIGFLFGREAQITWLIYSSIPLRVFFGSAVVGFFSKRLEGIIAGAVISAFLPVILQ